MLFCCVLHAVLFTTGSISEAACLPDIVDLLKLCLFSIFPPLNFGLQSGTESWHSVTAESERASTFLQCDFDFFIADRPVLTLVFPHVAVILLVHVDGTSVKNPDNEEWCVCVCVSVHSPQRWLAVTA